MILTIHQKKLSIGAKYEIAIDDHPAYSAASEWLRLLSVINLYRLEVPSPVLTIRKQWSLFKAKYTLEGGDGSRMEFRTISFWRRHYQLIKGNDVYDIYGQRGRKFSIYKNDRQIAWWDKKAISFLGGDRYTLTADRNSDTELIIGCCLIIDNFAHRERKGINIDFGNLGPQARTFNPDWQPQ